MSAAYPYREGVVTDRMLSGLDAQQRDAVSTDAAPLAILAAAGSGKTTVLTRRIARRIGDGSADPRHILAITFTRDAAGELRRRLRRLDVRDPIETGTFHAVALRLLRDRALTRGVGAPVVANDRLRLMREAIGDTKVRCDAHGALADLDWARARLVHRNQFSIANRELRRKANLTSEQFARIAESYDVVKRRRGVIDFDDLLEGLLAEMRNDQGFAEIVRWRFRHLFIDEAQDLNPLQFELLHQLRGDRTDICLVGDPRQAIYGWNGADPTLLDNIERHLPGITIVRLTGNYRCSPEIVRVGTAALGVIGMADDTESRRDDGRQLVVRHCADESDETINVTGLVRSFTQRYGNRQVAVLARTNDQLPPIAAALAAAGIAVERSGGTSHLDRCIAEACRSSNRELLAAWAENVWESGDTDPVRHRVAEEVDRYLSSNEPGGLRNWIEARQPFDDLIGDESDGAVSLLTFHAAKGREWSAVVVVGVEQGLIPHSSATTQAQRSEEARLLHVAVTRAGDELVLTTAASRGGRATNPSPWLDDLAKTIVNRPFTGPPASQRVIRPPDPLEPLRSWRADLARAAGVPDTAMCANSVLRSLLDDPPVDVDAVAKRLGVSTSAAERLAPRLLALLGSTTTP